MSNHNKGNHHSHQNHSPRRSTSPQKLPYVHPLPNNTGNDEDFSESTHPSRHSSPEDALNKYHLMRQQKKSNKNKSKEKYILKEQMNRRNMLEKENRQMSYLGTSQYGLQKSFSLSIEPTKTDSIDSNFHESDWTPVDSSYGGAFPFCGWIPKRIRQAIEQMLLVIASFTMIYFLVTVAMKLTSGSGRSSGSSSSFEFDDDHYIQNGNDDAEYIAYTTYYNDDDDMY